MASLRILKGLAHEQYVSLDTDRVLLGRDSECDVVIPEGPVSRRHAQIVRTEGGYFLEDLKSRNSTYLNDQRVTERVPLKAHDRIRICDFVASFEEEDSSSIRALLSHSSQLRLEQQPAAKLRALLEVSSQLVRALEFDELLPLICERLFTLFPQADRAFLILADQGENGRLVPRVVKTRRPPEGNNTTFSTSIVRLCLRSRDAILSEDASLDHRMEEAPSVMESRVRSVLCAPLIGEGGPFGVLKVDCQDPKKKFEDDDLRLLVGVANQASVALENARYHAEKVVRERFQRELEVARQVQRGFLPEGLPDVHGYEFFAAYEPAQSIGGDYYGFLPLSEGRLAVAVGDVCGKGVSAALLMVKLASDARLCLATQDDAAVALRQLNDMLYPHTRPTDRFVTLCLAILDPARHRVTLTAAGHPSPLLYRAADGTLADAIPENVGGGALGVQRGASYSTCEVTLGPGDGLVLFSDGVTDARGAGDVRLGPEGLRAAILAGAGRPMRAMGEGIAQAIQRHSAGRAAFDDVTLVCFGRRG